LNGFALLFSSKGRPSEKIGTKKRKNAAAPVKPEFHAEFVELSALYFSGEISDEEWALLQVHLAYCESCHERFLQYQRVSAEVIPALAAELANAHAGLDQESAESAKAAEERLMHRLESLRSPAGTGNRRKISWSSPPVIVSAACAVGLGCLVAIHYIDQRGAAPARQPASAASFQASQPSAPSRQGTGIEEALRRSQEENAGLKRELTESEERSRQSSLALADIEHRLETEQTSVNLISQDRDSLAAQLASARTEIESMQQQLTEASSKGPQQSAHIVALEIKVRELNASLEEKDTELSEKSQMLDLDKDLLAHDRDIRDVIGARNLYIADISDLTANGKTAKQFGRIFYTKDRSLIFYGFDLDTQAGRKTNVSFQAWGSGSDTPSPVSLGLFYQDDAHKRWVLRCNDQKTLSRLEMVFVTVEPPGGSAKPTGKQLLRAYLQVQPNHP
jgi:hypothetical protein